MSTKRTIDYEHSALDLNLNRKGKRQLKPKTSVPFHLFTDMLDDDREENGTVYLGLQDVFFSASKNTIIVGIPPDVWNRIVAAGPVKVRKGHSPEFPEQKTSKARKHVPRKKSQ